MKLLPSLGALAIVLAANVTSAETPPSIWDRTKDPNAEAAYALHLETLSTLRVAAEAHMVQKHMSRLNQPHIDADLEHTTLVRALERLERFHVEDGHDINLRIDLSRVLHRLLPFEVDRAKIYQRSAKVLRAVIADHPDHPQAEVAWSNLSEDCGHVGDHACERECYLELLKRATEDAERLTPTLNLAETDMHAGRLEDAAEGYRETLRLAGRVSGDPDSPALATWGLSITLDRAGDHVGGDREAKKAVEREQSIDRVVPLLHSDRVYFFPDYELHWYDGLRDVAIARMMKDPADQVAMLVAAEKEFSEYIAAGEKAKDRWLEIAKARLAAVKTERAAAEKKKAAAKPAKKELDEEPSPVTF